MNKNDIIKMLEYSGESYNDIEKNNPTGLIYNINDSITDVSYNIRLFKDVLVICFRGSDSEKDWSFNLDFHQKVIPYGNIKSDIRVHSGFLNAYKSKNVRNKIKSFINNDIKKIKLTGHSYGAALAILCAVDLQYNFCNKDYEVIVFGAPRVGNKAFRDSYNRRIFKTLRIENKSDIVTKLPLRLMGYRHVGARLIIGNNFLFPSMKKHYLQEYYSNIWGV